MPGFSNLQRGHLHKGNEGFRRQFWLLGLLRNDTEQKQHNELTLILHKEQHSPESLVEEPSAFHSLYIAIASTLASVVLGFIFAYALTRTAMGGKTVFRTLGMLPLYIPPLAHVIGLIYLFGNQGVVTTGLFGVLPGFDINLYGSNGIIIGEALYCFPQTLVILTTALSLTDARLYEAADALRTPPWRTFLTITIPSVKYGLVSAVFVCFTLAFTDFGVPKVVGGDYDVLATDIYKYVCFNCLHEYWG